MLNLLIHIQCDECKQQFQYARTSAFTTDAVWFNTSALTAMLSHYDWRTSNTEKERFHFCPECCSNFDLEEELAAQSY